MRENRPYGSEGGVGANRSRPLSYAVSLRCGVASERSKVQWLWVPAFAGTTADSSVPTTVEEVSQAPARGRQQPRSCRQWRDAENREIVKWMLGRLAYDSPA